MCGIFIEIDTINGSNNASLVPSVQLQVLASATLIDDSQHGVRGKRVTVGPD